MVNVAIVSPAVNIHKTVYKSYAFEPIISIKTHEPQHVYDLEIENTHNFIANGIVAHNTYVKGFGGNTINMSGNVLLMHFNNDSANGENQTNPKDWSGKGNNGTWFSSQSNGTSKLGAQSGFFDGIDDFVNISHSESLNITENLTVAVWIKPQTFQIAWANIIGKSHSSDDWSGWTLEYSNTNANVYLWVANGAQAMTATSTSNLKDNSWHHVVGTYNGTTASIYVDGAFEAKAQDISGKIGANYRPLTIGRWGYTATRHFNGSIDEVAIWNRTLSPAEIKAIYDRQKGQFIDRGIYESQIFDAGVNANWTNMSWYNRSAVANINLTYIPEVRSCDDAACLGENYTSLGAQTSKQTLLPTNASRYFQYKFRFATNDSDYSPQLYNVTIEVSVKTAVDAAQPPDKTGFGRRTTNLNNENNFSSVNKFILENETFGEIAWLGNNLNISANNFTQNIRFVPGSVTVNSSGLSSTLNSSANITLYHLRFNQSPVVLADGIVCINCTVLTYTADNNLTFNVTHFTNYSAAANSNLTIFDMNDTEKSQPTRRNFLQFYANYTNRTSGVAINISAGGLCNISFNITPTGPFNMTFNASSQLQEYNTSISTPQNIGWNVTCTATNYEQLTTQDDIFVQNAAPTLSTQVPNQTIAEDQRAVINLSSYITDPDADNITFNISSRKSDNISYTFYWNGTVLIEPARNFNGIEWIYFGAKDTLNDALISNNVSINITSVFDNLTINGQVVSPSARIKTTPVFININVTNIESTGNVTCNLTGSFNDSQLKTSGTSVLVNFSVGQQAPGTYIYNATCYDEFNKTSREFNFTVANATDPDLRVLAGSIIVSNDRPDVNETIRIYGEVENLGTATAENVYLRIRHGATEVCNGTIASLPGLESRASIASCSYKFPAAGVQILTISADPDNTIRETVEDNNDAVRSLLAGVSSTAAGIGMNVSINVTESGSHIEITRIYANRNFNVNGTAHYTSGKEPAPGADITITFTGTNTTVETKTLSYASFTKQSFSAGSNSGNYTVNVTVTDGLLLGRTSKPMEVLAVTTEGCPTTFPDPDLFISSDNFRSARCVESLQCTLTFTIRNSGCPGVTDVNYTTLLINETSLSSLNVTNSIGVKGQGSNTSSAAWTPPVSGPLTFVVDIDPKNNITESDENNNRYTSTITVRPNQPDLIPTQLKKVPVSDKTEANSSDTFSLTITNAGGADTSASFTVDMFIDGKRQRQNTTSEIITSFDDTATVYFTYEFNDTVEHNVTFVVDSANTITESIELNNNLTTTITALSAVDLELKELAVQNSSRIQFNKFIIANASFENIGNKNITGTQYNLTLYYWRDPSNSSTRSIVNWTNYSQAIQNIRTSVLNVSINVTNATNNAFKIEACVDDEDKVVESGYSGVNCLSLTLIIFNGSDINANSITSLPARTYHFVREKLTLFFTISNEGNVPVSNVSIVANISGNGTSMQVNQTNFTGTLAEFGGTAEVNFSYTSFTPEAVTFNVRADDVNNFSETNEGNNELNFSTTFYYPDVRVTASDIIYNNSLPYINQTFEMTVLVHDDSVFKAYNVSVNLSRLGKQINISNVTEIPAGSADSVKFNFTPNQSGTHIFRIQLIDNLTNHEHGNQNNDIATQSVYVRDCAAGNCLANVTVNYPNSGGTITGTINVSAYVYDEDGSVDGGRVQFYYTKDNVTRTFIGSTNISDGSYFSIGGSGALYQLSWDTTTVADGEYWLFANASISNSDNDTSDQFFTIDNVAEGGGGSPSTGAGGDEVSGGSSGGRTTQGTTPLTVQVEPVETPELIALAKESEFEAQPIKIADITFTNDGITKIKDIHIDVGITPEEVTKVIADLDTIETKFDEFTVNINNIFANCDNASNETIAEITSKAAEIREKFDDLKNNLLAALKVGAIASQEEADKLNAQIDDLKRDVKAFTDRLQSAYEQGKLCSVSELFVLQRLLVNMLEGFELLKADVLKALKASVLGAAEPYLPLYPVKTIVTCVGAFEVTLLPVSDRLLTPQLLEPIVIDKLEPGETLKKRVKIKMPMTARDNVSIDVVYTTYGQEIGRERVSFDLIPKIAASAVHVDGNIVDLYAVISELPGTVKTTNGTKLPVDEKQVPLPEQLNKYAGEDITLEIAVLKNASINYNPSLKLKGFIESVIRGPTTPFDEILGPYPLKPGERFLLAQQFKYNPNFAGNYQLEFIFRRGNEFIARQRHDLTLTCADDSCSTSMCTQTRTSFVSIFGMWLLILIVIAFIVTSGILFWSKKRNCRNDQNNSVRTKFI